jgi:hypothetical protein
MDGDGQLILISFKTFYEQLRIIQFEDIAVSYPCLRQRGHTAPEGRANVGAQNL